MAKLKKPYISMDVITKKEIPRPEFYGRDRFVDIFKKVAGMSEEDAVHLVTEKPHHATSIRKALEREFKYHSFKVIQRKIDGKHNVYITKKKGS